MQQRGHVRSMSFQFTPFIFREPLYGAGSAPAQENEIALHVQKLKHQAGPLQPRQHPFTGLFRLL